MRSFAPLSFVVRLLLLAAAALLLTLPTGTSARDGEQSWVGRVEARPTGGTIGTWTVQGRSFTATNTTEIKEELGPLSVGTCAEVKYVSANGADTATRIERQLDTRCTTGGGGDDSGALLTFGVLNSFPPDRIGDWTIGGTLYRTTATTTFGTLDGPFAVGVCVKVKYTPINGINQAFEIETQGAERCGGSVPPTRGQRYGIVSSFPAGLVGTWVISGTSYTASANTEFRQERGPFFVGGCVEVAFALGSTNAVEISTTNASDCGPGGGDDNGAEQKAYGVIESIPAGNVGVWRIGGVEYTSTLSTTIEQEHGLLAVGVCAEVEFTTANGVNTARKIGSEDAYRCGNGTFLSRAVGTIDSFPPNLVGTWVISGTSYEATVSTSFERERPFAVGGCVKVSYVVQNGVNVAQEIESEGADDCTRGAPAPLRDELRKLYAPIEALPASPFVGSWRIGGVEFTATAATRFQQENGSFAAGVCVEARYVVENGVNQLVRVKSKPAARCQAGGVVSLRAYGPVNAFPTNLVGSWTVGGITYTATPTTTFEQRFGPFAVGAFVEVKYRLVNGARVASEIETHVAPGAGREHRLGRLDSRPSDDTGTWVIGGVSYRGDDAIEVEIEHEGGHEHGTSLAQAPGTIVIVNFYRAADGALVATSITAAQQVYLPVVRK